MLPTDNQLELFRKSSMLSVITLVVYHDRPLPNLMDLVACRAWTLEGVRNISEVGVKTISTDPGDLPTNKGSFSGGEDVHG